jgi:hypothetical protein
VPSTPDAPAVEHCRRRNHTTWTTCDCTACTRDRARLGKLARTGRHRRVPSADAWAVIDEWVRRGWTGAAIASATGLTLRRMQDLAVISARNLPRPRLGPGLSAAIVTNCGAKPTAGMVGAHGARRRLQGLARIGWSGAAMAREAGLPPMTVSTVMSGTVQQVTSRTDDIIRVFYDQHLMRPGGSVRASTAAERAGWAAPMAWDDHADLDDPDTRPHGAPGALQGRRAQVVEDCEVIAADGGTLQAAAQRLGKEPGNLTRSLYRAGRPDLVAALTRQARGEDAPGGTRGVARSRRARAS